MCYLESMREKKTNQNTLFVVDFSAGDKITKKNIINCSFIHTLSRMDVCQLLKLLRVELLYWTRIYFVVDGLIVIKTLVPCLWYSNLLTEIQESKKQLISVTFILLERIATKNFISASLSDLKSFPEKENILLLHNFNSKCISIFDLFKSNLKELAWTWLRICNLNVTNRYELIKCSLFITIFIVL